jgi:hypothetical protein
MLYSSGICTYLIFEPLTKYTSDSRTFPAEDTFKKDVVGFAN